MVLACAAGTANAQTNEPKAVSGSIWADLFVGPDGDVIYPQYVWNAATKVGIFTGYGFVERAPKEPLFTNHVNTFTLGFLPVFSVRSEIGGALAREKYFFQVGPQVNIHEVLPFAKKAMQYFVVSQLPGLVGEIRPPNTLIAGATRRFRPIDGVEFFGEGYRRFFPGGRPDYSEYWLMIDPRRMKHMDFGVFMLQDGKWKGFAAGVRIAP